MFKKAMSLLLIYSILVQGGTRLGIYAYFQLNQDYIAKVLCVNKDKPAGNCKGKCFLTKQLKMQEEKEKKTPIELKPIDSPLFIDSYSILIPQPTLLQLFNPQNKDSDRDYAVFRDSIFHPPLA